MHQEIVQKVNEDEKSSQRSKGLKQEGQKPKEINIDRLKAGLGTDLWLWWYFPYAFFSMYRWGPVKMSRGLEFLDLLLYNKKWLF